MVYFRVFFHMRASFKDLDYHIPSLVKMTVVPELASEGPRKCCDDEELPSIYNEHGELCFDAIRRLFRKNAPVMQ